MRSAGEFKRHWAERVTANNGLFSRIADTYIFLTLFMAWKKGQNKGCSWLTFWQRSQFCPIWLDIFVVKVLANALFSPSPPLFCIQSQNNHRDDMSFFSHIYIQVKLGVIVVVKVFANALFFLCAFNPSYLLLSVFLLKTGRRQFVKFKPATNKLPFFSLA